MKQVADRKQCSACRYQQCLRAGMRTDLILDEEEKKTRFRKALEKKKASLEGPSKKVGNLPPSLCPHPCKPPVVTFSLEEGLSTR